MRKSALLFVLLLAMVPPVAVAQSPIFLPVVWRSPVPVASLVLEPDDMPDGYELTETSPFVVGSATDGHQVWYNDLSRLLSGALVVGNVVLRFGDSEDASQYVASVMQDVSQDDTVELMPAPAMGDEAIATRRISQAGHFTIDAYTVTFRRGNLVSTVATSGLLNVVEFDDAVTFAQLSLDKIGQ